LISVVQFIHMVQLRKLMELIGIRKVPVALEERMLDINEEQFIFGSLQD